MNNNFGYLESGTLIQEGTILRVWREGDTTTSHQVNLVPVKKRKKKAKA